ncbi:RNA polymerase sigma factor [Hugenholtzia roseola]|uniref:RNA polymerase sigma factor n=1 Tax=Hugenholtzia roseola TaxID=1002 RepID=UPI000419D18A|nr:RNA polymerase sigma factor [Hugenholtzia roseola]
MSVAEETLIEAAQKDPQAFQVLYQKYFGKLLRYVLRKTGDEELAADLTQQTFLKALLHLPKFEPRGVPFSAWLYRIATNEVYKHFQQTQKMPVYHFDTETLAIWIEQHQPAENREGVELLQERLQKMQKHLKNLSESDLNLIQLRFFEDKSFKEIAYILEASESATKMRLYRILEKMKKQMTFDA